jgi:hypothetical protein
MQLKMVITVEFSYHRDSSLRDPPNHSAQADLDAFSMPSTANRQFKAHPRLLVRAEGMHYWTADGRKIRRSSGTVVRERRVITLPMILSVWWHCTTRRPSRQRSSDRLPVPPASS